MRRAAALLLITAIAVSAAAVLAALPPPPPPDFGPGLVRRSCGDATTRVLPPQIPVAVETIDPQSLGVRDGKIGRLTWNWGFRITGKDNRLGQVVGLELSNEFGLLAVTRERNWITLDLQKGTLADMKTVGIARIAGAPGAPSSLAQVYKWMLVSFPEQNLIADFELSQCGVAAKPAPLFTIVGRPKATIVAEGEYTYVGLVGQDGSALKNNLVLAYGSRNEIQLDRSDLTGMADYRLQALSNPARIVPFFIAAWRPADKRPETLIQQLHVPAWAMWLDRTIARLASISPGFRDPLRRSPQSIFSDPGPPSSSLSPSRRRREFSKSTHSLGRPMQRLNARRRTLRKTGRDRLNSCPIDTPTHLDFPA